jgi:YidC/Oxa1 family membrane protein insertase
MDFLGALFGCVFKLCYVLSGSFFWSIVWFTIISKIALFPISLISQKNSIVMLKIQPLMQDIQSRYAGEFETILKEQKALYKKEHYSTFKAILPLLIQIPIIIGVISVVNKPDKYIGEVGNAVFAGLDLLAVPNNLIVPILAIVSTLLLCVVQNKYQVLSREQGFFGKWGVAVFLVVFTGWFSFACPQGVGLYWTLSNLTAIIVLALCNIIYNPKKYIDYENRSVKPKLTKAEKQAKRERKVLEKSLEKEDMKRFFSVKKELVFYSDSGGFYKYFQHFIDYILEHSDIRVHYLTADINDRVFKIKRERFETYFCSSHGLITTFMKMDADIVIMTMPDLEVYHYKRSLVRKDIEYIYTDHGEGSYHLMLRKGALDHFDTIFCYSKNHNDEIRAMERVYGLQEKKLVDVGFGLLDMLIENYNNAEHAPHDKPQILIAPSWQKDNILEYCLDPLLRGLFAVKAKIIIRPHPEFVKRFPGKMKAIFDKYADVIGDDLEIQTDFSSNSTVYNSDLIITDWSSIAQEFSLTTKKPSLFINTPMKVMNIEWRKLDLTPQEISIRDIIGVSLDIERLGETQSVVENLLADGGSYRTVIEQWLADNMYNMGHTAEVGGGYIIKRISENRENRDNKENTNTNA